MAVIAEQDEALLGPMKTLLIGVRLLNLFR